MHIVVTGADGFIGRNLRVRLEELDFKRVTSIGRSTGNADRQAALKTADIVIHLAGVNRPGDVSEFDTGNRGFTATLCSELRATGRPVPLILASSTQALLDNPYGASKRAAEQEVEKYAAASGAPGHVFRLPNVFGKWCRPNYNSGVATFCHNIARGMPITVNDASAPLRLVYVDDVVDAMIRIVREPGKREGAAVVSPVYETTVGEVATMIREFAQSRDTRLTARVGTGFTRALYATYVSYLPPGAFAYSLTRHADARGVFAEMLKTPDCGQFSFFTAHPGVTRGGHYHHTKTEKFLVVKGRAKFGFRHIVTNEVHELLVTGDESRVVETVPGWAHDITNVGDDEMVVMLWANEVFDPQKPDTIASRVTG
jgi:UDP-2-acetamido-2,6-beta-L-arabino-hexul-4-ose reductase